MTFVDFLTYAFTSRYAWTKLAGRIASVARQSLYLFAEKQKSKVTKLVNKII